MWPTLVRSRHRGESGPSGCPSGVACSTLLSASGRQLENRNSELLESRKFAGMIANTNNRLGQPIGICDSKRWVRISHVLHQCLRNTLMVRQLALLPAKATSIPTDTKQRPCIKASSENKKDQATESLPPKHTLNNMQLELVPMHQFGTTKRRRRCKRQKTQT